MTTYAPPRLRELFILPTTEYLGRDQREAMTSTLQLFCQAGSWDAVFANGEEDPGGTYPNATEE
jgi:hypothetical protein